MKKILYTIIYYILIVTTLFGCDVIRYKNSTFKVETNDLINVKSIVNYSFIELGFDYFETIKSYTKQQKSTTYPVKLFGFSFEVQYISLPDNIIVKIKNNVSGFRAEYIAKSDEYRNEIIKLITNKLEQANLNATVETSSYSIPAGGT